CRFHDCDWFSWLESHTVTANSLPRVKKISRTRVYTHAYTKDASLLPRNARFPSKWTYDLNRSTPRLIVTDRPNRSNSLSADHSPRTSRFSPSTPRICTAAA